MTAPTAWHHADKNSFGSRCLSRPDPGCRTLLSEVSLVWPWHSSLRFHRSIWLPCYVEQPNCMWVSLDGYVKKWNCPTVQMVAACKYTQFLCWLVQFQFKLLSLSLKETYMVKRKTETGIKQWVWYVFWIKCNNQVVFGKRWHFPLKLVLIRSACKRHWSNSNSNSNLVYKR